MVLEECPAAYGAMKCPHLSGCTPEDTDYYYVISATGTMKADLEKLTQKGIKLTPEQEKYLARIKTSLKKMGMI